MVSGLCLRAGHLEVHKPSVMAVCVPGVLRSASDSPFTLAWPGVGSDWCPHSADREMELPG